MDTRPTAQLAPSPGEWVTLAETCRLTGERNGVWYRRATREADAARSVGRKPLAIKASIGGGRAAIVWWLHRSLDARLALDLDGQVTSDRSRAFACSEGQLARAWRRARWLIEWRQAIDSQAKDKRIKVALAAQTVRRANEAEGAKLRISVRSLQMWWRRFTAITDQGVAGLQGLIERQAER